MTDRAGRQPTGLRRPRHAVPDNISESLLARGLVDAYRDRPAYQQNDYIGWIGLAKRKATREQRLAQMLDELEQGGLYMKMAWRPGGPGSHALD